MAVGELASGKSDWQVSAKMLVAETVAVALEAGAVTPIVVAGWKRREEEGERRWRSEARPSEPSEIGMKATRCRELDKPG